MSSTNGFAKTANGSHSEQARIQALREYSILDTLQKQEFEAIPKMGLPLLKNFVDVHDGSIMVESDEGDGAKFTVLLPELNSNN